MRTVRYAIEKEGGEVKEGMKGKERK